MAETFSKLEKKHKANCIYVTHAKPELLLPMWLLPPSGFDGSHNIVHRDARGGKRGKSHRFLRFVCRAHCGAVLLVRAEDVERAVSNIAGREKGKSYERS